MGVDLVEFHFYRRHVEATGGTLRHQWPANAYMSAAFCTCVVYALISYVVLYLTQLYAGHRPFVCTYVREEVK